MKLTVVDDEQNLLSIDNLRCGEFGLCVKSQENLPTCYGVIGCVIIGTPNQPIIIYSENPLLIGTRFKNTLYSFVKVKPTELTVQKI